jgi:hypothetical protein
VFGALLDAMVVGLRDLPRTRLPKLPRMADFALWATACETAIWEPGTFWNAYCGNQDVAADGVLDADLVADALRTMMAARTAWTGKMETLLGALRGAAGEEATREKSWPKQANTLSRRLRRSAIFLRKVGISIEYTRDDTAMRTRLVTITRVNQNMGGKVSSNPSSRPKPFNFNPSGTDDTLGGNGGPVDNVQNTVRDKSLKSNGLDGSDDLDDKITRHSGNPGQTESCEQCGERDERPLFQHEPGVWVHLECLKPWLDQKGVRQSALS